MLPNVYHADTIGSGRAVPDLRVDVLHRFTIEPEPGNPLEAEGVLNPANSTFYSEGGTFKMDIYPRIVASGNVSRIGRWTLIADERGDIVGVDRTGGVLLEPSSDGPDSHGVEDPRYAVLEWLDGLRVWTYVAYDGRHPRVAFATASNGGPVTKLGVARYASEPGVDDINGFFNKDAALLPHLVKHPDTGDAVVAMFHRPYVFLRPVDRGVNGHKPCIWMSFCRRDDFKSAVLAGESPLWWGHRLVGRPLDGEFKNGLGSGLIEYEIDGRKTLLGFTHGVFLNESNQRVYAVRLCVFDHDKPWRVLYCSPGPLIAPTTEVELSSNIVPDKQVVFATMIAKRPDGNLLVGWGSGDVLTKIGVIERAQLDFLLRSIFARLTV